MAPTSVLTGPAARLRDWPAMLAGRWRHSLRFRTASITLVVTSFAVLITFVIMALAIHNDLFESRKAQVLEDARRAVVSVQSTLDSADVDGDRAALRALWRVVRSDISRTSSSSQVAAFRIEPGPAGSGASDFASLGFRAEMLSEGLRARVADTPDRQWWQSVSLSVPGSGNVAGIVVGQQLRVPTAGTFELYMAYDLAAADQTLLFVQRTLWLAGLALVAVIAGISWFVLRSVSVPIVEAAETSARLASGDLGVRLRVHGEDELSTLGHSFNAMADSIEGQIKELAELSLVQQRFVSDVSHELRTPLTTIRLAADMLHDQRAGFEPTTARTAELLHTQVQRFETLLSDLLEISRYDAGSVQLEREATSLAHLAEDVVEQMRPLAESRGSDLRLVAPGGYSPVDMDPRRVRRILRNLIGNAIEHGEGKPVVVTVDSDADTVAAGVRDFGLGMEAADVERVFDRFWRADPSRVRTIGGTGLGLSISLGDARLHGGTLEVWSERGAGSNFVLTLPRQEQATLAGSPVPLEPAPTLHDLGAITQPMPLITAPGAGLAEPGPAAGLDDRPEAADRPEEGR